jgi:hypothetical protein
VDRIPLWIKLLAVVVAVASVLNGLSRIRPVPAADSGVEVLDPFADVAGTVATLHLRHQRAVCELNAGVWEPGRPDAARFDAALLGASTDEGRWLDIRQVGPLTRILDDRLALCTAKGFDGVSLRALDGYRHATGFPLTEADQARFNEAVSVLARRRGLSVDEPGVPA